MSTRELTTTSRRERLRAQMRDEILTAARQIVRQNGYKELTMRALGRAVGVTATTLYDYFANKDAVLDALFREGTDRLQGAFGEAMAAVEPGLPRLRALGAAYRDFAHADPDLFQLIFGRVDANYRAGEEEIAHASLLFATLLTAVQEAIAIGDFRPSDPLDVALSIWSAAHGYVTLEISGHMEKCRDQAQGPNSMFDRVLDTLYAGLRPG